MMSLSVIMTDNVILQYFVLCCKFDKKTKCTLSRNNEKFFQLLALYFQYETTDSKPWLQPAP